MGWSGAFKADCELGRSSRTYQLSKPKASSPGDSGRSVRSGRRNQPPPPRPRRVIGIGPVPGRDTETVALGTELAGICTIAILLLIIFFMMGSEKHFRTTLGQERASVLLQALEASSNRARALAIQEDFGESRTEPVLAFDLAVKGLSTGFDLLDGIRSLQSKGQHLRIINECYALRVKKLKPGYRSSNHYSQQQELISQQSLACPGSTHSSSLRLDLSTPTKRASWRSSWWSSTTEEQCVSRSPSGLSTSMTLRQGEWFPRLRLCLYRRHQLRRQHYHRREPPTAPGELNTGSGSGTHTDRARQDRSRAYTDSTRQGTRQEPALCLSSREGGERHSPRLAPTMV